MVVSTQDEVVSEATVSGDVLEGLTVGEAMVEVTMAVGAVSFQVEEEAHQVDVVEKVIISRLEEEAVAEEAVPLNTQTQPQLQLDFFSLF